MKVGFIGLGSMGYGQAMLLAQSSHDVAVFDVSDKAMARFEGKARLATSLGNVGADADVVGICVRDDAQVNDCVSALLPNMSKGAVIMVHSTVKPSTMLALAEQAAPYGVEMLDASVTRTILSQEAPFVYCMTGGDEATATRLQSVLDAYSTDTVHAGPLGAGMAMKISNNLVSWSQIMIGIEAFELAEAAGVATDKLLKVMKTNGVLTPPMSGFIDARSKIKQPEVAEMILSQSGIGEKDLTLAETLGLESGSDTPVASFIRARVKAKIDSLAD